MELFLAAPPNQLRDPTVTVGSVPFSPGLRLPAAPHMADDDVGVGAIPESRVALKYEPVCCFLRHNAKKIAAAKATAASMKSTPKAMATFRSPLLLV